MSLELVNPYTIKRIETTVVITPNQLNNDLKYHLLMNIKSREENKCNSVGFIKEIISLCDDTINGKLDITNTKGNCKFNLSYIANICIPIANTIIICKVDEINQIIRASYDHIIFAMKMVDYDNKVFKFENMKDLIHIKTKQKISVGSFIKVKINGIKVTKNDINLFCMGFIIDFASTEEVEKFYKV